MVNRSREEEKQEAKRGVFLSEITVTLEGKKDNVLKFRILIYFYSNQIFICAEKVQQEKNISSVHIL